MSNSPLVTYTKISPNKTTPRKYAISRFTIHCFVGQVTAQSGCNTKRFVKYNRVSGASCNYVVGHDGTIGLCVEEKDRSWCSSSKDNDHRAITLEVASETKSPYKVTDAALNALIDLMADICRRNGKTKVLWFADKKNSLAYIPAPDEMVMTVHRWFAAKACPGEYLYSRHSYIAEEVNKRLGNVKSTIAEPQGTETLPYVTVKKGDTLSAIGKKLGVSWKEIAALNGISSPYTIHVGQKLHIPSKMQRA